MGIFKLSYINEPLVFLQTKIDTFVCISAILRIISCYIEHSDVHSEEKIPAIKYLLILAPNILYIYQKLLRSHTAE